jgi:small subunit ribosomal protein S1
VHISELSYTKRVLRPEDVVKVGKVVPVVVKEVDAARRRISLSIRDAEGDPWMDIEEKYHVGQVVQGTIEKKEQFGYFVALEPGITGLLPSSNVAKSSNPRSIEKLRQGDPIEVVIEVIRPDERRITLGPGDARDEQDWRSFARDAGKPLGSLGEKLHQALKSKREP